MQHSHWVGQDTGSVRAFSLVLTGGAACAVSAAPKTTATRVNEPNAAGWNSTDATLAFAAADNKAGSGVREIVYSAAGAQTVAETASPGASATLNVTAEGTTTVTFYARDNAGNAEAARTITVKVDKTAPAVNVSSPANTAYALNQAVTARYTCSDAGSGLSGCAGPVPEGGAVDTSTLGAKTFVVTSSDIAGNTSAVMVNYTVGSNPTYRVKLLYDPSKAHQPGSTVPVKIQPIHAITGQNVSVDGLVVHALGIMKESDFAPGPVENAGHANPDDDFRFTNFGGEGGYIFNLKTNGLTTGTYVVIFRAGNDPFTYRARFQVK